MRDKNQYIGIEQMKKSLVCCAGGGIGGHLVRRLTNDGYWIRDVDIKMQEDAKSAADGSVKGDLRLIGVIVRFLVYLTINKHTFIII